MSTLVHEHEHTSVKSVSTPTTVEHPLDPLTVDEIAAARALIADSGRLTESSRFTTVLPVEPDKAAVAAFTPGDPIERRILFVHLDLATGLAAEIVVSVTSSEIISWTDLDTQNPPYGQPPWLFEEYDRAMEIVKADAGWRAAMERRGLADKADLAFCSPLAPGFFGREDEVGHRVIRSLTFLRENEDDNPWPHPVEGLIAHVDLTQGRVIRLEDEGDVPVPDLDGNYGAEHTGPARTSLKPLEIVQPEGPSFQVEGSAVTWENWKFRVGFNAREGLVLNQVSFRDGDEDRPVLYRASVPEMVVPYGDTSPCRYWISYFDAGEYLLGKNTNSLELGCDCLGTIHYFDGVIGDEHGHPLTIPQAVCMHEEDYGVLWKHTDLDGTNEARRSRRLVVSYFATVGNYDYGFFWYFYLDGTIQVEAKATGIVFAGAEEPGQYLPHATEIAPGLYAPVHQHLFCARLDVAVDGEDNTVNEVDVQGVPTGPDNPYGNAFTWTVTPITKERDAARLADQSKFRVWEVRSAHRTNRMGKPTAYQLVPQPGATLMAQPDSTVYARANFATKHLWATAYAPDELYPAGPYPNGHEGWAGLPTWQKQDRDLENTDIVLWHVFGPTHLPRPEDWPVMPVDYSGFMFKPYGFLDMNPALNLPDGSIDGSCDCEH